MNDILIGKNESAAVEPAPHFGDRQGMLETMAKQTVRTVVSRLGRQVQRDMLGGVSSGLFGGKC